MLSLFDSERTRSVGTYDDVACEYYDSRRHPTCGNFREASRKLISTLAAGSAENSGWNVEVGAGKSLLWELASELRLNAHSLVISDLSFGMLEHSFAYANSGALLVVCDAARLPCPDESISLLVSSLGDPYNTPDFWKEVNRVLRSRGICYFTSPSFEWARRFRSNQPHNAEFVVGDRHLYLPSYIYSDSEQERLVSSFGLRIEERQDFHKQDLEERPSVKLDVFERDSDGSIVTGLKIKKLS